jgi:ParB family chromosome partitioning protein
MSLDLDGLDGPAAQASGAPLLLPVELIDEDPHQPRVEFDADALRELAATIKERGVRQPISVRSNRDHPGRWVLNFGARRLRASALAGCASIPAFIDETADSYDQVIENEQRESLKPLELALFVQRRLAVGESQAEIGRRMGKSRQYVMIATALIDAPDWLMDAYRSGRCRGLNELHELRRLHAEHPQAVEDWASDGRAITREQLQGLRSTVAGKLETVDATTSIIAPIDAARERCTSRALAPRAGANRIGAPRRLLARLDGAVVSIVIDAVPRAAGHVFVQDRVSSRRRDVDAASLTLIGFSEP